MRAALVILIGAMALAGCKPATPDDERRDFDQIRSTQSAGANFRPVPGFKYQYHYRYAVPADAIFDVQKRHVQACNQIDIRRCRVVEMQYDRDPDGKIRATLRLQVARDEAANFGASLLPVVSDAEGILVNSNISSFDLDVETRADERRLQDIKERLDDIDRRLKDPNLSQDMKTLLLQQRQRLLNPPAFSPKVSSGIEPKEGIAADSAAVYRRPGSYRPSYQSADSNIFAVIGVEYESRNGYDDRLGFRSGWSAGIDNFVMMTGYLLSFIGLILPWLLLLTLVLLLWRFRMRIWPTDRPIVNDPAEDKDHSRESHSDKD